jgi:ABC-type Fe3+ transport system substrate-binding protein
MLRIARLIAVGYLVLALATTAFTLFVGPVGEAMFRLPTLGPGGDPITVTLAYGTEKRAWLEDAVERFAATSPRVRGRPIEIELVGLGSREMVSEIVDDGFQPTAISPASSIQIELLRDQWARQNNGQEIFLSGNDAPQPLVITPLVLVVWQERAELLFTNGHENFWNDLHNLLAAPEGWGKLGRPEWGFVNFGQTSPETSNSGIQTLVLMSYGYYDKSRGLSNADVLDPEFQQWLAEMQSAVPDFENSTGNLMIDMLRFGPSKYSMVSVYENLAIENFQTATNRGGEIRVYYPPVNIYSEHPYAVLDAPWVTNDEREAAASFRSFLLSDEMQRLALETYGYRPVNLQVPIDPNDPNNPFSRYASYGITYDIAEQVEVPPAEVLNTLIEFWRREIRP